MTGADEAVAALRAAAAGPMGGAGPVVHQARTAAEAFSTAGDLVDVLKAAVTLVVACEAVAETFSEAAKAIRAGLVVGMASGATTIETEGHVASLKAGTRAAVITDRDAIPREYWRTPEPAPDKVELAKLLRRGRRIEGVELANHCPDVLQIKRKDAP